MTPGARVLVMPAGIEQVFIIRKARELGLFVVALDANPQAAAKWRRRATSIAVSRLPGRTE